MLSLEISGGGGEISFEEKRKKSQNQLEHGRVALIEAVKDYNSFPSQETHQHTQGVLFFLPST